MKTETTRSMAKTNMDKTKHRYAWYRNIKPCVINVYVWHELWQQYEAFCICYKKLLLINNRIFHFVTCDMAFMSPKMSATINKNHTHDDKPHLPTAVKCGSPRYRPFFGKPITEMMDYRSLLWWTFLKGRRASCCLISCF